MKTLSCLILLTLAAPVLAGERAPLPPGMARADQPQEVAALHSVEHEERAKALRSQPKRELTAQEAYQRKLIAYREQLVEEQRQRKLKELEVKLAEEKRLRAEEEAYAGLPESVNGCKLCHESIDEDNLPNI